MRTLTTVAGLIAMLTVTCSASEPPTTDEIIAGELGFEASWGAACFTPKNAAMYASRVIVRMSDKATPVERAALTELSNALVAIAYDVEAERVRKRYGLPLNPPPIPLGTDADWLALLDRHGAVGEALFVESNPERRRELRASYDALGAELVDLQARYDATEPIRVVVYAAWQREVRHRVDEVRAWEEKCCAPFPFWRATPYNFKLTRKDMP